ncbi:hypothetical protein RRG08_004204 [Elysia crispata]|uniref:Uncharacterized protein n=1 Tax=Elysia crispata TaxID=231223 RepID=A0AAE1D9W9_9GAST|nr:hypothetical protein RRG08_004204 [Elysia crispata]
MTRIVGSHQSLCENHCMQQLILLPSPPNKLDTVKLMINGRGTSTATDEAAKGQLASYTIVAERQAISNRHVA